MSKTSIRYLTLLLYGLIALLILILFQFPLTQQARAASNQSNPQITISMLGGGSPVGHPGAKVHIAGSGFPSGTVILYTTAVGDPNKCTSGDSDLTPFDNAPKINVKGSGGSFQFDSKWPTSAATATTAYYLCAIDSQGNGTLSNSTFTVALPVTLTVSPTTIQPGGQITLTGTNWLPAQVLSVGTNIPMAGGQSYLSTTTTPDAQGNFTVTLTVPNDASAGSYAITANAPNENTQLMQILHDKALTVTPGTPTPTVTSTATPTTGTTPTTAPTATQAPGTTPQTGDGGSGGNAGGGSGITMLIVGLGGAGVLLVVIGVIIWAASGNRG